MRMIRAAAIAALIAIPAAPALAQEFSFSGEVGITSNYMSRGVTQSDSRPALSFGLEAETMGFYAGLWLSSVRLAPDNLEVNLYAGYRFSVGIASFDLGYAHYVYDDTGNCCSEIYLRTEADLAPVTVFGALAYDPDRRALSDGHVGVSYAFLDRFSAQATVGRAPATGNYGILGLGFDLNESVSFAADYHISPVQSNQLVLSTRIGF